MSRSPPHRSTTCRSWSGRDEGRGTSPGLVITSVKTYRAPSSDELSWIEATVGDRRRSFILWLSSRFLTPYATGFADLSHADSEIMHSVFNGDRPYRSLRHHPAVFHVT